MSLLESSLYSVTFDAATMGRIAALVNAQPTFAVYYTSAMRFCVNLVNMKAQENAPVKRGTLRRGIRGYVRSPWLGQVGVLGNVPYGRRRERGFDGRTDRLGRYFPRDPRDDTTSADGAPTRSHMFYLQRALETSRPAIGVAYRTATQMAIRQITIGEL
jgi:hypothetical protein